MKDRPRFGPRSGPLPSRRRVVARLLACGIAGRFAPPGVLGGLSASGGSVGLSAIAALATAPAAAATETLPSPVGDWLAEDIGGGGVLDRVQTTLTLAADGAVSGTGGCNRYFGKAEIKGARLTFGPLGSTRMACTPAVMAQEQKFLATLERVAAWRVDTLTRKLFLLDLTGTVLVRFSAA